MKTRGCPKLLAITAACLCCCSVSRLHAADTERHVVLVSLDGLAAYLVDDPQVPLPTIRKLAKEGAIVDGGMTVSNPTVTWPNHTTRTHPHDHRCGPCGRAFDGGDQLAMYARVATVGRAFLLACVLIFGC